MAPIFIENKNDADFHFYNGKNKDEFKMKVLL